MVVAMLHHFLMALLSILAIKVVVISAFTLKMHLDGTVSAMERAVQEELTACLREGRPYNDSGTDKRADQIRKDRRAARSSKG